MNGGEVKHNWGMGEKVITGNGFTLMEYVDGMPVQPFAVGVTVIKDVIRALLVLLAVNDGTSPVPLAASPIVAI